MFEYFCLASKIKIEITEIAKQQTCFLIFCFGLLIIRLLKDLKRSSIFQVVFMLKIFQDRLSNPSKIF